MNNLVTAGRRRGSFAELVKCLETLLGRKLSELAPRSGGTVLVANESLAKAIHGGGVFLWVERSNAIGALGGIVYKWDIQQRRTEKFPFQAMHPTRPWKRAESFWSTAARMVLDVLNRPDDSPWPQLEHAKDLSGSSAWSALLQRREWRIALRDDHGEFVPLYREQGTTLADPFPITVDGMTWVLFEEQPRGGNGMLSAGLLRSKGLTDIVHNILPSSTHRSWPNTFHRGEDLWMLPESGDDFEVALWRCARFPNEWEKVRTLLDGADWRDPVLVEHAGLWWMFASRSGPSCESHSDSVHLFFSPDPWSKPFQAHPWNPVSVGVVGSRPAGRIIHQDGGFIRPTQDGSGHYGRGIVFRRIREMTPTAYLENTVGRISAPKDTLGIHTWNQTESAVLIDLLDGTSRFG